ncbi:chorismate lyase [Pseudoalteromonas shioyasakiensis]|uniref:chorismate--pyruvate lyase family protein n=1 Tax=Pseudoalteromonas shioyasakiensis TaxID=1190813 RepID=UPI002118E8E5|nr:chorismate lyase [Pseudoalteromonas shioyasakiensis]
MITFPLSLTASWQRGNTVTTLSQQEQNWLLEPNSLTAKLKRHGRDFSVQVLSEKRFNLSPQQQQLLDCHLSEGINREVLLWCNGEPMVYAQSWLPVTQNMQQQKLLELGDKPLGDVIFQHPELKRTEIEIARFDCHHAVQQLIEQPAQSIKPLWARRSVFSLAHSRFLVCEVFLPKAFIYQ